MSIREKLGLCGSRAFPFNGVGPQEGFLFLSNKARISVSVQTDIPGLSLIGLGNRPCLMPSHQPDRLTGITGSICSRGRFGSLSNRLRRAGSADGDNCWRIREFSAASALDTPRCPMIWCRRRYLLGEGWCLVSSGMS